MSKTVVKWALIAIGGITLLVMEVLAVPVQQWLTGEIPQPDLQYSPPPRDTVNTVRLRIDVDAACGTGKRRKSDDCLTLLLLCPSDSAGGRRHADAMVRRRSDTAGEPASKLACARNCHPTRALLRSRHGQGQGQG